MEDPDCRSTGTWCGGAEHGGTAEGGRTRRLRGGVGFLVGGRGRRHARPSVPDRGDPAPERRRALTDWAHARGGLIVEDDYDGEFRYDRQPVGALQGMAPGQVAYLGTASKTLGPALRLGWMVLPPHLVDAVADVKLHSNAPESIGQLALAEMITSHAYRPSCACLPTAVPATPGPVAGPAGGAQESVRGIAAGLHWWTWRTRRRCWRGRRRRGSRSGISASTGTSAARGALGLVVGYGTPRERIYPEALEALGRVLDGSREVSGGSRRVSGGGQLGRKKA